MEAAMNKEPKIEKNAKKIQDNATALLQEAQDNVDGADVKGKAAQLQERVSSGLQQGIDTIKNIKAEDVKAYASDIGSRVKDVSSDLGSRVKDVGSDLGSRARTVGSDVYADPIGFVKRYPVTSAIALAGVGFLIGSALRSRRNAA